MKQRTVAAGEGRGDILIYYIRGGECLIYPLCRAATDRSREQIAHGNPRQVKRMGMGAIYYI